MMIFLAASMSCASVVAPVSEPIAASQPCLDIQGQRELLAGVELVIGDEKNKCDARVKQVQADSLQSRIIWGLVGGLIGGATVGVILGATR